MKRSFLSIFVICFGLFIFIYSEVERMPGNNHLDLGKKKTDVHSKDVLKQNIHFSKIPLYFTFNKGQVNKRALFYARAARYTLWITKKGLVFDSQRPKGEEKPLKRDKFKHPDFDHKPISYERDVSRLMFLGANKNPEIIPVKEIKLTVNYFKGNDRSKWICEVPTSEAVLYKNIYKNIDLKVYGFEKQIEYDWIIKPGGDPKNIQLEYKNVKGTRIDKAGNLVIKTDFGELMHKKPFSYQKIKDKKVKVESKFKKISKNIYGFKVQSYDKGHTLIIDPVILLYSTYLGGGFFERGKGIAVDSSGHVYVTGRTTSPDFPCLDHYQTYQGSAFIHDVFITKIDTTQSGAASLIYSTYIGGRGGDHGEGIAVDNRGNAYVTGKTTSTNFPCMNQYQAYQGGTNFKDDVFVTKIDTTKSGASGLVYSTYLGGNSRDIGSGIALDSNGYVYVTGYTTSTNFPCVNQYQKDQGKADIFISKIDTTQSGDSSLIYSTYLGCDEVDYGFGIAVDNKGNAYVTGYTYSSHFPCVNQYQTYQGKSEVIIAKIDTTRSGPSSLIYSTCIGGRGLDYGKGIAVDNSGNAYVTGHTYRSDFPCLNQYQTCDRKVDVFIVKIDTTQSGPSSLIYSTCIGGGGYEDGYGIAVDNRGNAYVTGTTQSAHFTSLNQYQAYQGHLDAFIAKIDTTQNGASSLVYSTYLGGNRWDFGYGIAVDSRGNAYITGYTASPNFPCFNQYHTFRGDEEAFVTKLILDNPPDVSIVSPEDGSMVCGKVQIEAQAEDELGISKVEFYIDDILKQTVVSQSYPEKKERFVPDSKKEQNEGIFAYVWDTINYFYGDHEVKVVAYDTSKKNSSDKITVLVHHLNLNLQVSRNTEKGWIIKKQYGKIDLMVENPDLIPVSKVVIHRKIDYGDYNSIKEISFSEFQDGSYTYFDKYLETGKTYTYRVEVLNPDGIVITKSEEKTI